MSEQMQVHPAAAVFPMMTDDELQDLAEDIKANGLINPIVVDEQNRLVDGRNRHKACGIAGVEPRFEPLNGRDPRSFIVSANINRRNLTRGQRVMAIAMIYPEPGKRGRGGNQNSSNLEEIHSGRLAEARAILNYSPEMARAVMAGTEYFDAALKKAKSAKQDSLAVEAQMAMLRSKVPDVAAMVDDERLTIAAALEELSQRQKSVNLTISAGKSGASKFSGLAANLLLIQTADALSDADLALVEMEVEDADPIADLSVREIEAAVQAVQQLYEMKVGTEEDTANGDE